MNRILIAAAAALLSTAASAHGPDVLVRAGPTARVSYADLDIHSLAGQATLAGRIRTAADSLCIERNVEPLKVKLLRIECYSIAVASGGAQVKALTAR